MKEERVSWFCGAEGQQVASRTGLGRSSAGHSVTHSVRTLEMCPCAVNTLVTCPVLESSKCGLVKEDAVTVTCEFYFSFE